MSTIPKPSLVKGSPDSRKVEVKTSTTKSPTVKSVTVKAVAKSSSPKEAKTVKTVTPNLSNERIAKLSQRVQKRMDRFVSRCEKLVAYKDKTNNVKLAGLQKLVKEQILDELK